ncbi:MAG: hypothetical protein Q8K82_05300 [Gemmatimonadaceae bacterium]|nr:hypothetical protein [Gemmatimonadaceae bacterium]
MAPDPLPRLIERWRVGQSGTHQSWFLWEERRKNFRSIRRGITRVVDEIQRGSFGNAYRGASLETVVGSIAEQRQLFKGADHAFLWKPKLRIPDIYEHSENQRAFGTFLDTCACCASGVSPIRRTRRAIPLVQRTVETSRKHGAIQLRPEGGARRRALARIAPVRLSNREDWLPGA